MAVTEDECCSSAKARSSQTCAGSSGNNSKGVHYLAKCVVKGSAVHQVLYGHIRSLSSLDIVLGKETSLELVIIGEDGTMQSVCDQAVFGIIKDLAILRWNAKFHEKNSQMTGKDVLVVLSDSGKLSFLTFCTEMHRFFPVTHIQLSNPGNSINQLGRMLAIDSSGCFVAVCAYEVRLALFSISTNASSDIIDERITYPTEIEGDTKARICGIIWSMCFISSDLSQPCKDRSPVLAIIINRKGGVLSELILLKWNIENHCVFIISHYAEAGPLAQHIVEVPCFPGFAFVFRLGEAHLMDFRDANNPSCVYKTSLTFSPPAVEERNYGDDSCRPHEVDEEKMFNVAARALLELSDYGTDMSRDDDPMNIDGYGEDVKPGYQHVCSWSWEPGNDKDPRMIFCIDTGGIYMIEVSFDFHELKVVLSECLYKGQPCNALLWAECGYVAAFVEMGDGMILKFSDEKLINVSPIQNIAPILDMSVIDYNDAKHDQILACCGVASEGSLRLIHSGISVDKLLRTAPVYDGIIGTWTIKMKQNDNYHSFLVLSFFWEKTRVLLVGLSFSDVTDSIGFQPDVSTLACGLVNDCLLVQIHPKSIRLCLPTKAAHPDGIPLSSPICTSWSPDNNRINLGAVGHNMIVVATKNPCFLFILGVRLVSAHHYELHEMLRVSLQNELSCISIPRMHPQQTPSTFFRSKEDFSTALPVGFEIGTTFVIGTHKPSVEVLSFVPDGGLRVLAMGTIPFINTGDTTISDWNAIDVRLVFSDRLFILSGLRNGMMIRFDWPTSSLVDEKTAIPSVQTSKSVRHLMKDPPPSCLQLISMRRIGIKPVFLIPLSDSLDADIIALSDRPWLLHASRHCLSYTSISVQPSTHVTSVRSIECPEGVLFVTENSLQLVEMVHSKRLNVQKFYLGGTPRKVLYHSESRLLLVMRNDLDSESFSSDVCFMDPLTGSVHSSFKLELGETGKSMELIRVGNEQVLVIGTSLCSGPAMMPSGEAESTKGRLIVVCLEYMQNSDSGSMTFSSKPSVSSQRSSPFSEIPGFSTEQLSGSSLCSSPDDGSCDGIKLEEIESWQMRVTYSTTLSGMVVAICTYLDRYFLASAGNAFYIFGFPYYDNPQRRFAAKRLAVGRTRYMIVSLTALSTRIAIGDCRDGIIFYSYDEEARKLEQHYCDPAQRLTADCILMAEDTAIVTDRKGSIAVLSCASQVEENATPESNLTIDCAYYMGEVAMSIRKISLLHKHPANGVLKGCDGTTTIIDLSRKNIVASTLSGSIMICIPLLRDEYEILEAVQARLVVHPLTSPVLGNDHLEFRSRENSAMVSKMLDGDMLCQFLELTSLQQEAIVELPLGSTNEVTLNSKPPLPISVSRVVQLLERVHYALN